MCTLRLRLDGSGALGYVVRLNLEGRASGRIVLAGMNLAGDDGADDGDRGQGHCETLNCLPRWGRCPQARQVEFALLAVGGGCGLHQLPNVASSPRYAAI